MQVDFTTEGRGVLVKAQNVYDYFEQHGRQQGWDDLHTFVCAKPPFPRMVISYDGLVYEGNQRVPDIHIDVLVEEYKGLDLKFDLTKQHGPFEGSEFSGSDEQRKVAERYLDAVLPGKVVCFRVAEEGQLLPLVMIIVMDDMGRVKFEAENAWVLVSLGNQQPHPSYVAMMHRETVIALGTLNLMNCRNVQVLDNPPSRQQRRAAERQGQRPPVTYKTLHILPFARRARVAAALGAAPSPPPMHIVRGHFKDYRAGRGLGRWHLQGIWWWHPHVRGDATVGRVEKDYQVDTEGRGK